MDRGLELAITCKVNIQKDQLYQRWLVDKNHLKDKRMTYDFEAYLDLFFNRKPKKVKKVDKVKVDSETERIRKKFEKGGNS